MARNKGTFKFPANFEVKAAEALDPRVMVTTKAELITKETWPYDGDAIYLYKGILVSVQEENAVYMLVDTDKILSPDYSGWEKISGNSEEILNKIEQLNLLDFNIFNNENRLDNRYISDDGELKEIYKDKEKNGEEIREVDKITPTTCYRIQNNGYKKIKGTAGFYHKASRVFLGFYSDFESTPETLIEVAKYPEDLSMDALGIQYILNVPDNCKSIVISELVGKIGSINYEAYASMYENSEIVNNFDSIYNKLDKIESTISKNPNIQELTYQEFTQLKLDYKLDIGKQYKITNYQTFIGENQYPNIPEISNIIPVIVTATGANTIDQFGETEDSIVKIELFNSYKYPIADETKIKFGNTLVSPTSNRIITYNNEQYVEIKTPSDNYFYIKSNIFDAIRNDQYRPYNKIYESIFAATIRFDQYNPDYGDELMAYANYFEIIPKSSYNRGMGEILWMKDKNGNSAPWDFKSIKWKFSSDNLPEGFDINTEYSTFDNNSFNNTILIDELISPVILRNSYNNIINIKNSSLICTDSADNDVFVENNDNYNQINNINKSIIKLSNNNLNYVKKLSEGLFLDTYNNLLDDMLNYNNEIVINEPLTGSVSFNIKGQCSLDFKIGSELPPIEFTGVKNFIKELELVENTRYLILFDQKIQNNNKTDIVAIWAAVSNT